MRLTSFMVEGLSTYSLRNPATMHAQLRMTHHTFSWGSKYRWDFCALRERSGGEVVNRVAMRYTDGYMCGLSATSPFWKEELVPWTGFSYELPIMCPSGSSSCRKCYHANRFSTSLVLLYFHAIVICMGKIGNGHNFCILLYTFNSQLPSEKSSLKALVAWWWLGPVLFNTNFWIAASYLAVGRNIAHG